MTKQKYVLTVIHILMLLCILNSAYVHSLRYGWLKGNGVQKKLLSNEQNRRSFADASWFTGGIMNIFGYGSANPWEDFMKHFVTPTNHIDMKPIKGAQFGLWDKSGGKCKNLKEEKINGFESNTVKSAVDCGTKLFNKEITNEAGYNWANWDSTEKCLVYKSEPNCLLYKPDGYAFSTIGMVNNSRIYDLPPCIDNSKGWKIQAKCGADSVEKKYECVMKKWVADGTKIDNCLGKEEGVDIEEKAKGIGEVAEGELKEEAGEEEEVEKEEEEEEEEGEEAKGEARNKTGGEVGGKERGETGGVAKGEEGEVAAKEPEVKKVIDNVVNEIKEKGQQLEEKIIKEVNQTVVKIADEEKNKIIQQQNQGAQSVLEDVLQSDEAQQIIEDKVKNVAEKEQHNMMRRAENTINDELKKATSEINREEMQAKRELDQEELNAADDLRNQAKNIENNFLNNISGIFKNATTSSAKRYALTLGAVDVAFMLAIATFVL